MTKSIPSPSVKVVAHVLGSIQGKMAEGDVVVNIKYRYVGENVRNARLNRGLTIEQLAELADITDSFLGVAERGTSGFSIDTIVKLAKALDVTTDSLLLENYPGQAPSSKVDTLATILSGCAEDEIDFMIEYVKLCKKMRIFKAKAGKP